METDIKPEVTSLPNIMQVIHQKNNTQENVGWQVKITS